MFWNPQDLLLMMDTEIFNIDASWAQKFTKTESAILIRAKCSCTPVYPDYLVRSNNCWSTEKAIIGTLRYAALCS